MRFEDIYCKVGVKFLNKKKLSDKTYYYLITKDWINNKRKTALKPEVNHFCDPFALFKIINEKGYDYKGTEIAIVDVVRNFSLEDTLELTAIKDLLYTRTDKNFSVLECHSNTFEEKDFYGEKNNLLTGQLFNTCSDSTANTKAESICNCTSETVINNTLADSYVYHKPYTTTTTGTILIDSDGIVYNGGVLGSETNSIQREIDKLKSKESEEKKMFNFNHLKEKFQFGEYKNAKMSPYGIAFQNGNEYFAVNTKTMEVIDATGLVFDFNCVYSMPVAANAVKVGDFIVHNYCPVLVRAVHEDGTLKCWHINAHEVITVLPVKSPFGFNFYTKLVSLVDNMGMTPTNDNPFGNIWPLVLMDGKKDNKDMMMLMMLMNQQGGQFNPMMMYMMMDGNKSDFLPMMLMMNGGFNFGMTPTNCKCNHPEEHGDYSKIMNGEA